MLEPLTSNVTDSDGWEMSPKLITFEEKIGEGAFGTVYSAIVDEKADLIQKYIEKYNKGKVDQKYAVKVVKGIMLVKI